MSHWVTSSAHLRPSRSMRPPAASVAPRLTAPMRMEPMMGERRPASRKSSEENRMSEEMPQACMHVRRTGFVRVAGFR